MLPYQIVLMESNQTNLFFERNGYPLNSSNLNHCSSAQYSVSKDEFERLTKAWLVMNNYSTPVYTRPGSTSDEEVAYVVEFQMDNGEIIEAALAFGHGVLDGKCKFFPYRT